MSTKVSWKVHISDCDDMWVIMLSLDLCAVSISVIDMASDVNKMDLWCAYNVSHCMCHH